VRLFNQLISYFDVFAHKCDFLQNLHQKNGVSKHELINANNQLLSDLINLHAKSTLLCQYVSLHNPEFDKQTLALFGNNKLVKEVIKVGSNLSRHFGYCGFCSDSPSILEGFSLVIDRKSLAFSHNDMHLFSNIIASNIRLRKVINKPTQFNPSYQLPTYSMFGVNFHVVPVQQITHPYIDF